MALANQWDALTQPVAETKVEAVRAMEEREAAERKADEADAISPEEAARRAKALLDQLKGSA
jgi:hypothetical protein